MPSYSVEERIGRRFRPACLSVVESSKARAIDLAARTLQRDVKDVRVHPN
jgi:hypothetical protein